MKETLRPLAAQYACGPFDEVGVLREAKLRVVPAEVREQLAGDGEAAREEESVVGSNGRVGENRFAMSDPDARLELASKAGHPAVQGLVVGIEEHEELARGHARGRHCARSRRPGSTS